MGWGTGNIGGGSAGLNFKIVGGTTEPGNPKENTIWVNTETPITSWLFSATEPETPLEGMVWISTGASSPVEFNALKKNGIQVCPVSAEQYISGEWVNKTMECYQAGEWRDIYTYLFSSGAGKLVEFFTKANSENSSIDIDNIRIKIAYSALNAAWAVVTTENVVSLTDKKTLYIDMTLNDTYTSYGGTAVVGITPQKGTIVTNSQPSFSAKANPQPDGIRRVVEVDISGIDYGYVTIYGILNAEVYGIWLW